MLTKTSRTLFSRSKLVPKTHANVGMTTRTLATSAEQSKKMTETKDKVEKELEKANARESDKLFYQLFPEAIGSTDAKFEEAKDIFSSMAQAFKPLSGKAPSPAVSRALNRFNQLASRVLYEDIAAKKPVKVAITGASGQIGYALLFRIASGQMFGETTPVQLHLLELPQAMNALQGVIMELQDCAFPLVHSIHAFDDPNKAFEDIDYALLVGAKPRSKGMERGDLLTANAEIFSAQGKALNAHAKKTVKVAVVGNPANTNALIAQRNAPSIPAQNFTAMTRLDHNRGLAQIANKTGVRVTEIKQFAIWGNHSATQYPSLSHATIRGKPATEFINDKDWIVNKFIPDVQQRGAAIIAARGASSAASAAGSLVDHVHDWIFGTGGEWTSMAVPSNGEYGVEKGLNFSFPVVCAEGKYAIVENLPIDPFSAERLEKTHQELKSERDAIAKLLPK